MGVENIYTKSMSLKPGGEMDPEKLEFANAVINVVKELCHLTFNVTSHKDIESVFGMTEEQMKRVIERIVNALPKEIFEKADKKKLDELKHICAREFVFFQVQEKWTDPDYETNLTKFIQIFVKDIPAKL